MANRVAVVGVGQTKYAAKRLDVNVAGLVREAAKRALDDAGMTWSDIDAVVIGKAPDMFEGMMMPELYLADALGAVGKPMLRVHTAGSVGGSTAIVAASMVQSGVHQRVLTIAWEKQSESNATWALTVDKPHNASLVVGAGGYFAPHIRAYMRRSGAPDHIGTLVAVKDREVTPADVAAPPTAGSTDPPLVQGQAGCQGRGRVLRAVRASLGLQTRPPLFHSPTPAPALCQSC